MDGVVVRFRALILNGPENARYQGMISDLGDNDKYVVGVLWADEIYALETAAVPSHSLQEIRPGLLPSWGLLMTSKFQLKHS